MQPGGRYLVCPACGLRGVVWKPKPHGEDLFKCRYMDCHWSAFTVAPHDREDAEQLRALRAANPERVREIVDPDARET